MRNEFHIYLPQNDEPSDNLIAQSRIETHTK